MIDAGKAKDTQNHAIFIDKNHSPAHFKAALEKINNFCPFNVTLKLIAVTPKCLNKFSFNYRGKKIVYPFSLTFFFNCLERVKNRKIHDTLNWEREKTLQVILLFFNFYKDVKLNDKGFLSQGFDHVFTT